MPPETPQSDESALFGSKAWIPFASILVVGCALRVWTFDHVWINPDEGIYFSTVTWSQWSSFWEEYSNNAHPPLFYLLLKAVSAVTVDVTAMRSIALIFGCSWIAAMFLFARECGGRGAIAIATGWFAAFLVAVSDTAIEMSQLIRPYSMQAATMTFALFFLVRYIRDPGRGGLPAYATLMIVALLTHYGTILVLVGLAATCCVLLGMRALAAEHVRSLMVWNLPVLLVVVLCYLLHIRPNLDGSEMAVGAANSWLEPFMMDRIAEAWPLFLGLLGSHIRPGFEGPAAIVCVAGLGLAVYRRNVLPVVLPLATLAVAVLLSAAHKYPFGGSRHSLCLLVVVAVPIAFAVATLLTSPWRVAVPSLLVLIALSGLHSTVSAVLGSTSFVRETENTLRRSDLEEARAFIRREVDTPGIVLMSMQTYFVLLPEYQRERNATKISPDGRIGWFRWGARNVVVLQGWTFQMSRETLGHPTHLYTFVENVDRQIPALGLGAERAALLLLGEWSAIMPDILRIRSGPPEVRTLVGRASIVPGFAAVEFDVAGYVRIVAGGSKRGK